MCNSKICAVKPQFHFFWKKKTRDGGDALNILKNTSDSKVQLNMIDLWKISSTSYFEGFQTGFTEDVYIYKDIQKFVLIW